MHTSVGHTHRQHKFIGFHCVISPSAHQSSRLPPALASCNFIMFQRLLLALTTCMVYKSPAPAPSGGSFGAEQHGDDQAEDVAGSPESLDHYPCRWCDATQLARKQVRDSAPHTWGEQVPVNEMSSMWCNACRKLYSRKIKQSDQQSEANSAEPAAKRVRPSNFEHKTAASSHTKLSALSPKSLATRCSNVSNDRTSVKHQLALQQTRNTNLEAENMLLRQQITDQAAVAESGEFLRNVKTANAALHAEGFARNTFHKLAGGFASGAIHPHSVEAHHLGDLACNHSAKSRGGFRFSRVVKDFCCYLLLLSRGAYRALRGAEGLNLGTRSNKPICVFNIILPHENMKFGRYPVIT